MNIPVSKHGLIVVKPWPVRLRTDHQLQLRLRKIIEESPLVSDRRSSTKARRATIFIADQYNDIFRRAKFVFLLSSFGSW